jgi:hypothetical protein
VSDAVSEGYPMSAMLSQLHDDVLQKSGLPDVDKALICEKIAQVCITYLHMLHFNSVFALALLE